MEQNPYESPQEPPTETPTVTPVRRSWAYWFLDTVILVATAIFVIIAFVTGIIIIAAFMDHIELASGLR